MSSYQNVRTTNMILKKKSKMSASKWCILIEPMERFFKKRLRMIRCLPKKQKTFIYNNTKQQKID